MKFIDITGQQFNKLAVVSRAGVDKHNKILWNCVCDCGNKVVVLGRHLKSGNTKSCGCLKTTSKYLPADCGITDQKERNRQIIRASQQCRAAAAKEAGLCISCCKNKPSNGLLCEVCTERNRMWAKKNPKKMHAFSRKWCIKNAERVRAYEMARYRLNPDKKIHANAKRRAQKKNVPSDMTVDKWLEIVAEYDHRCAYCFGTKLEVGPLQRDHVVPLAQGGSDTVSNIVPACKSCNSSKGARTPNEWLDG